MARSRIGLNISLVAFLTFCLTVLSVCAQMEGQPKGVNSPAAPSAKLQSILEQREKAGWQAFKDKNKSAFADVTVDEYTTVLADGQGEHDRQATLDAMSQITIHRYSLTDFKLTPLGANAALLRYNASTNYSLGDGQGEDHKLAVGDIWVKRGKQWKSIRYQETEAK